MKIFREKIGNVDDSCTLKCRPKEETCQNVWLCIKVSFSGRSLLPRRLSVASVLHSGICWLQTRTTLFPLWQGGWSHKRTDLQQLDRMWDLQKFDFFNMCDVFSKKGKTHHEFMVLAVSWSWTKGKQQEWWEQQWWLWMACLTKRKLIQKEIVFLLFFFGNVTKMHCCQSKRTACSQEHHWWSSPGRIQS